MSVEVVGSQDVIPTEKPDRMNFRPGFSCAHESSSRAIVGHFAAV